MDIDTCRHNIEELNDRVFIDIREWQTRSVNRASVLEGGLTETYLQNIIKTVDEYITRITKLKRACGERDIFNELAVIKRRLDMVKREAKYDISNIHKYRDSLRNFRGVEFPLFIKFPVSRESIRNKCRKLSSRYRHGENLDEGSYGAIDALCIEEDCRYILKTIDVQQNEEEDAQSEEQILNEINILHTANQLGIGPRLVDSWKCDGEYYIVMERLAGNMGDYLKQSKKEDILDVLKLILRDILPEIKTLMDNNIVHGDIKFDNIFHNIALDRITLGDFGMAFRNETGTPDYRDVDYLFTGIVFMLDNKYPDLPREEINQLAEDMTLELFGVAMPLRIHPGFYGS